MPERITDPGFCVGRFWNVDRQRAEDYVVAPDVSTIVVNGPPGTGKTNLAIWNAVYLKRAIIAEDAKGEISAILGPMMRRKKFGGFRAINPYGLHAVTHAGMQDSGWNPCRDIKRGTLDVPEDCQNLVIACNERHNSNDANSFFDNSATEIGAAFLQDICINKPDATPIEWRAAITEPYGVNPNSGDPVGSLKRLMRLARSPEPSIASKAGRFTSGARSNAEIMSSLAQITGFIDFPALRLSMQGPGIDWATLKNSAQMLALVTPPDKQAALKGYRRMFWQTVIRELIRAPRTGQFPPAMLLIDEAPQLGRMQVLLSAAAIGRGYGIRPVIICQDFSQLRATYGNEEWETFITTASAVCSFAPNSIFTAEYLSKMCGNKIVVNRSASRKSGADSNINLSDSYHDRRLFEPYQLMQMPPGRMLVLFQGMPPFFTQVENYWESSFASRLAPNPYYPNPKRGRS